LNEEDENRRNFRLERLQDAFFQDLSQLNQPILIILDTFNAAPDQLVNWIGGGFLTEAITIPKLTVVIAGQQVPKPTIEWMNCHHFCRLEPILDTDAWYTYAKNQGLPFNQDEVRMAVRILKGLPAEIVKNFEALAREQQS
jgi:hypothetical protein